MNLFIRLLAAVVSFLVFTGAATAQSSARAQISNIRFSLVDLDLYDGVTPALVFLPFVPPGASNGGWEIYDPHTNLLVNDEKVSSEPLGVMNASRTYVDEPHLRVALSSGVSGSTLADKVMWASGSMTDTVGENNSNSWIRSG